MGLPAVQERFRGLGADPGASSPEAFGRIIREEFDKWRNLARTANLKFD